MIKYLYEFFTSPILMLSKQPYIIHFHNKIEDYINDNLQNMKYKVKERNGISSQKWHD